MPIDFKQVAAPTFSGANELLKLAQEQQQAAMTGFKDTVGTGFANIQDNNHAQMLNLLNTQTREQMLDPIYQQELSQKFQDIAAPSGGIYDPLAIEAMRDGAIDKDRKREDAMWGNSLGNLNVQDKKLDVNKNTIGLARDKRVEEGEVANAITAKTDAEKLDVAKQFMFLTSKVGSASTPEDAATYQGELDALGTSLAEKGDYGYMQDVATLINQFGTEQGNAAFEKEKQNWFLKNSQQKCDQNNEATKRLNIGSQLAVRGSDRADAKLAFDLYKYEDGKGIVDQKALETAVGAAGYSNGEINLQDGTLRPDAVRATIGGRIEAQRNKINNPLINAEGKSVTFASKLAENRSAIMKSSPHMNENKMAQVTKKLNSFRGKDGKGNVVSTLNETDKWEVMQAIASGVIPTDKWSTVSVGGLSNYEALLDKNITNYVQWLNETHKPAELDKYKRDVYNAEVQKIIKTFPNADHKQAAEILGLDDPKGKDYHLYPSYIHDIYGQPQNGKQFKVNTQADFVPISENTVENKAKSRGVLGNIDDAAKTSQVIGLAALKSLGGGKKDEDKPSGPSTPYGVLRKTVLGF